MNSNYLKCEEENKTLYIKADNQHKVEAAIEIDDITGEARVLRAELLQIYDSSKFYFSKFPLNVLILTGSSSQLAGITYRLEPIAREQFLLAIGTT